MLTEKITKKLDSVKRQTLSNIVAEQLEEMILNGDLKSGERINESHLANLLNISRAPIREACLQLAQYGVVENKAGKGSYVRLISLDEALELYDLRGVLDALAAENACAVASNVEIERLGKFIESMQQFKKQQAVEDYFAANLGFHKGIVELSGNNSLIEMYTVISKKLTLFRQTTLSQPERMQASLLEHQGIYEAIVIRNSALAAKLAREHVKNAKEVLIKQSN